MHSRRSFSVLALTILSTNLGCEAIARVDRDQIPSETGGAGGAGGAAQSSSSSSSGQGGMGGMGGDGGMGGNGGMGCLLDSDCPATGSDCILPSCEATACTTKLEVAGVGCTDGNGKLCDGQGQCVECLAATDCAMGTACQTPTCSAGVCGFSNAPVGTKISDPTPGDCQNEQCDATGQVVTGSDDTDVPMPANECKFGACSMGTPPRPMLLWARCAAL